MKKFLTIFYCCLMFLSGINYWNKTPTLKIDEPLNLERVFGTSVDETI